MHIIMNGLARCLMGIANVLALAGPTFLAGEGMDMGTGSGGTGCIVLEARQGLTVVQGLKRSNDGAWRTCMTAVMAQGQVFNASFRGACRLRVQRGSIRVRLLLNNGGAHVPDALNLRLSGNTGA